MNQKVNLIARLEFELAYNTAAVLHVSHCTTMNPSKLLSSSHPETWCFDPDIMSIKWPDMKANHVFLVEMMCTWNSFVWLKWNVNENYRCSSESLWQVNMIKAGSKMSQGYWTFQWESLHWIVWRLSIYLIQLSFEYTLINNRRHRSWERNCNTLFPSTCICRFIPCYQSFTGSINLHLYSVNICY